MKKTITKGIKRFAATISGIITAVFLGVGEVFAATGNGTGSAVSSITTWGESLVDDIKKVAQIIMIGAIVVLGIMCATAGRGWAERLKSGAAGILIGVAILSFGTSIVTGLIQ
ncbi:MAG: TrbC/VirB2 family protein [Eubacterium sp.]|nr:TrbC/VirB2 family protein [Eubacterium sp.]